MILKLLILIVLSTKKNVSSGQENYKGDSFPLKYFLAEDVVPDNSDAGYYLEGLKNIIEHFEKHANDTDVNQALATFFMTSVLKRTIKENKNKIQEYQLKLINEVLVKGDNVLSHYRYGIKEYYWDDIEKRITELFKDEDLQIEGIGELNRNRLQKWIVTNTTINNFAQDMDELKLQRIDYLKHADESSVNKSWSISIRASDICLGSVIYNPRPLDSTENFRPCVADEFCAAIVYKNLPSISYTLSHRMLNVMFPRHVRRCFMRSIREDDQLLDVLCSAMYRETVYLARLGYFYRDIWMEHIALCGMLGYQEFFRRHWFRKVMSWIDHQGCIAEDQNFEYRRFRMRQERNKEPKEREDERIRLKERLKEKCIYTHQMAVGLVVLGHGVRHAVHYSLADRDTYKEEL